VNGSSADLTEFRIGMKQFALSQSTFDQFLAVLDSDRDLAGQKYETLRKRIVKFFEWRACQFPDDLADETLDRVMRKAALGTEIDDYINYAYGVARLVYLEAWKQQVKERAVVVNMPTVTAAEDDDEDVRYTCLESCLKELPDKSREMILSYYRDDKQAKIDHRKTIAEKFNISLNALRIKTLRLRSKLEECVHMCLEKYQA
jgi:DNA-directed RNA polymerase specialized sigma24 family protein